MSSPGGITNVGFTQKRAAAEVVVCSALWGFGFIATRWAMDSFDAFFLTGLRFLLAALLLFILAVSVPRWRKSLSLDEFFLAFLPGLFLSATLVLQTVGLRYTTVTNSGFITVLYVVFVPVLEAVFFSRKTKLPHIGAILLALGGAGLLCQAWNLHNLNIGDFLTLLCALAAAVQIVLVERASTKFQSPFLFNFYQSFWVGIIPFAVGIAMDSKNLTHAPFAAHSLSWAGLAFLVVGSTMIAFLIQMRAQRVLPSATASMLFLLESPFAAVFGYFIFNERMNGLQWTGAALIMIAAFVSARFGIKK
ncbi:MAG TPA: DMT family transporter [Oligoflexia bacterium]|nr:DMT family transporter [Oligoflexia bacterium]